MPNRPGALSWQVRRPLAPPLLVLAVGLLCTLAASLQLDEVIRATDSQRFTFAAERKLSLIRNRIQEHVTLLRGAAGLIAAKPDLTRNDFREYVDRLLIRERSPGVQGLGFSRRIEAADLDRVLARESDALVPDLRIRPPEPRPEYHAIVYLEPLDPRNRAALGFDMFTEPARRAAMERARDTGRSAATSRVELVQEIDEDKQAGFLIYVPVYQGAKVPDTVEARRAALEGFVYSPYRSGDLFEALFKAERSPDLALAVFAGEAQPGNLLFRSSGARYGSPEPLFRTEMPLEIAGRTWTVQLASLPAFEQGSGRELVPFVIAGGLFASLALAALAFAQVRATRSAVTAREELRVLNVHLEQRVAEAVAELRQAEDALRQAQKMEAVGQLTGGIAHDFNNMLAVVIGSLDLLRRRVGGDDPRLRRYVEAASEGARRAANLTQRLLAFSRQQPLKPEPIDANKLVAGMSDLLRHSLGSDVQLETVLAGGLWRIHVDPNQLENVILNLAVNARDAMPDGGRLTIETQNAHLDARYAAGHPGVPAGQYVLIAVTDTGSGMPPEVVARAFDPFFTTKEVGKGTGLGLSQAYGFVKQSGGHLKIYSEPGQGTNVKVYLPRFFGSASDAPEEDGTAADVALGDDREVVLVVDDEPAVRQFGVEALEELGYCALEADGALAALRILDAHPEIALLFTDVVMPEVNGRKLAEEARRRRPGLKVLFTTGYTRNAVVHNGVLDPGVELIGKPFTIEELAAKVREVLDMRVTEGAT